MYPDAFSIERLAHELNVLLNSYILKTVFSTSKSDLFFIFDQKKGFKMQFFKGQGFFQFPDISQFPLKNRMLWFESCVGEKVVSVNKHQNSRSFELRFENGHIILFKLFGQFSNVILFVEDQIPKEIFNLNHAKDLEKPYMAYNSQNLDHKFDSYVNHTDNEEEFIKANPWFGKDALNTLTKLGYFNTDNQQKVMHTFTSNYLEQDAYILKQKNAVFELTCFQPQMSSSQTDNIEVLGTYPKITEAFNDFTRLYIAAESFKLKKSNSILSLEKQLNQKLKTKSELFKSLEIIKKKRSYNQLGDMVMANLHSIHKGVSTVELFDFYNNAKVMVKLKTELNPQQNAAVFYRKAKQEIKEVEFKEKALEAVIFQIEKLQNEISKLVETEDLKGLRKLDKTSETKSKEATVALPYRPYKITGFDVMVGKNAKANDILLSQFASKNDLWFHAKDVSGSHVIIKNPSSIIIPSSVIATAASLAAWYSKAKTNSLVSVIYTLKKFVRKPKGAPPGAVIVEKEKGILVEPRDI